MSRWFPKMTFPGSINHRRIFKFQASGNDWTTPSCGMAGKPKRVPAKSQRQFQWRAVWATQNMQWRSLDDLHGGLKPSHWVNPLSQDQKMTPKHNFKNYALIVLDLWIVHGKQAWTCCFLKIYPCWLWDTMGYLLSNHIQPEKNRIGDLEGPHPTSFAKGGVAGCFGTGTVGGTGGATTFSTGAGGADLLWKFLEKPSGLTLCGRLICCWFHRPWNAWRGQPYVFFPVCSNLQWCFSMFQFGFRSKTILNLVKMGLLIVLYKYRKSPQLQLSRLLPQLVQLGLGTLALCRVPGVAPAPGSWVIRIALNFRHVLVTVLVGRRKVYDF